MADNIYQAPAVVPPTLRELAAIANETRIELSEDQLKEYQGTSNLRLLFSWVTNEYQY